MANRKTSRRSSKKGYSKLKKDFIAKQVRHGRSRRQAESTYKMLRGSARYRRQYALNPLKRGWSPNMDRDDVPIVNPGEAEFLMGRGTGGYRGAEGPLWYMNFAMQPLYVWARSIDDAFEEAVEWLDDNGQCGHFVTIDEGDIVEAAENEGFSEREARAIVAEMKEGEWSDDVNRVMTAAEADLTMVSHTTLHNCEKQLGTGPLYVPSWEWGAGEVTDPEEFEAVFERSLEEAEED